PWRVSEALEAGPVAIALVRAGRAGAMEAGRAAVAALEARPELNGVLAVMYTIEAWSLHAVRDDSAALLDAAEDGASGAGQAGRRGAQVPRRAVVGLAPADRGNCARRGGRDRGDRRGWRCSGGGSGGRARGGGTRGRVGSDRRCALTRSHDSV